MRAALRLRACSRRALSRALAFGAEQRASAAVEAAPLLPVALLVLALLVYGAEGLAIDRKVSLTARTVTDLVTQTTPTSLVQVSAPACAGMGSIMTHSQIDTDLQVASAVLAPYSASNMSMVISQVEVSADGVHATVQWSEPYNGATARPANQQLTLPGSTGTGQAGNCFVFGEVFYKYSPMQIFLPLSTLTLSGSIYLTPRQSASIKCSDCATPN